MLQNYLTRLISFKSTSDNQNECVRLFKCYKDVLRNLPLYFKEFKFHNYNSLLITTRKTKKPFLLLQAHIDVVGGSENIFLSNIIGCKLFGRGSFDMKYAAACHLKLLKNLGKDLPDYNFGILLTSVEEIGGSNGVCEILKNGYSTNVCFLPDGGENWNFQESAKGVLNLHIVSKGMQLPASLDTEARLSRLAGWVLAAERNGARYGLRLPGHETAPARGDIHRAACLQALALFAAA